LKSFLQAYPLYIFLLCVFFVLHGYVEHFNFIPVADAGWLVLIYIFFILIMTAISWLFFKNISKAGLFTFLLMSFYFFFGTIQDSAHHLFGQNALPAKYSFILTVAVLFFIGAFIYLKRKKSPLPRLTLFLNVLFVLFILGDIAWLVGKITKTKKSAESILLNCDSCRKPDIYFIILDEYAGKKELNDLFHFDNSVFEDKLKEKGFHIVENSRSNYNVTPYSVASILNMDYLPLNLQTRDAGNLDECFRQMRNSKVLGAVKTSGYSFYNYSIFDFPGQPAKSKSDFLPYTTALITSQTFLSRAAKDVQKDIDNGKWKFLHQGISLRQNSTNELIIESLENIAKDSSAPPKFIYGHLLMPHYPFYFDKNGQPLPLANIKANNTSQNYIEYLQYCNKKILVMVEEIIKASASPPVIILLGDHGSRNTPASDHVYNFLNLNAMLLPDKNYAGFYNEMSNVNEFRVIFNTIFHERLPLLKDSTVYLWP
jgi:hypothetical protein